MKPSLVGRSALALFALVSAGASGACRQRNAANGAQPVTSASTLVVLPTGAMPSAIASATAAALNAVSAAPAPSGTLPGAATNTAAAGALGLSHGKATVFRASDGNWHVRFTLRIQNNGTAPVDVDRGHFVVPEWNASGTFSTLPDHTAVNPGMAVDGDVTFYVSGSQPQPTAVTLQYIPGGDGTPVVWQAAYAPAFSPAPPAAGQAPTRVIYTLPATAATATGWENPDDHARHVMVAVTVNNTLDVPVVIPRDFFRATAGTTEGGVSDWGTTFADPTPLAPGATATGNITWYFSGLTAAPATVRVTYGPQNSPQLDRQVPVTAGTAPPRS